jgi:acetyltransferase-like isoleucine patch superfamily enzyme
VTTSRARLDRFVRSILDPRAYLHAFKLINFYNYSHVTPLRRMTLGEGVQIAPNASFREPHHIVIGDRSHIGERCMIWGGDKAGRVMLGADCLLGPEVMMSASNYQYEPGTLTRTAPKRQADIVIGNNVWLGARVIITAGVSIGDNCVIGAGAVVTEDIPANTVAVGVPARVIRSIGPIGVVDVT